MKKLSELNVVLTPEDLLLIKYLFETDFLNRDQIKKYVWNNRSESYTQNRLWRLTREGFLRKTNNPLGLQGETVLMATKKALNAIRDREEVLHEILSKLNRTSIQKIFDTYLYSEQEGLNYAVFSHDNILNEVRFILEELGVDFWHTSKILSRSKLFSFVADGIFQVKGKNESKLFAVELELFLKGTKNKENRYKEIFYNYSSLKKIDYVLYICGNDRIYKGLSDKINPKFIDYSPTAYQKFFLISLKDFLKENFIFRNPFDKDLVVSLKELIDK